PVLQCLPIPEGLTALEAASLPETFFTVWSNVFDKARLQVGESFLVHGGTSGIGVAAMQLANAMGCTVYATVGSDEKVLIAESLGAHKAINYKTQDFCDEIKTLTQGRGVDIILDMVAGKYLGRNIDSLADDGRLAVIALLGGAKAELDMSQLLRRRLTITGSTLRPRPVAFKAAIACQLLEKVWPLLVAGKVRPVIHQTFPLEQACQAHALMEGSQHIGKIMLKL
ncbi:MAG: NAD(P)H-quinone oxidoreductase, partial [Undibacterium sp.]|nr:NAD(P)H-quinone oxidoreductase [Undibacterium sp.]